MSRSRIVKPDFFKHSGLYEAESLSGLPCRLAFAGLWTVADREGRFRWKVPELKLEVLPYDQVNFGEVLEALRQFGFLRHYVVDAKEYGVIDSFGEHQPFHPREAQSTIPAPPLQGEATQLPGEAVQSPPASTSASASTSTSVSSVLRTGDAGKVTDRADIQIPTVSPQAVMPSDLATVMGSIRKYGYRNGKPPKKGDDARDATVARRLLEDHPAETVMRAVEGCRVLVEKGTFAGPNHWNVNPGGAFTLRLPVSLWGEKSVFPQALDAYYAQAPPEPTKHVKSGPTSIGEEIGKLGVA